VLEKVGDYVFRDGVMEGVVWDLEKGGDGEIGDVRVWNIFGWGGEGGGEGGKGGRGLGVGLIGSGWWVVGV